FTSSLDFEAYSPDYYKILTSALNCFVVLVDTFLKEARENLSADLKDIYFKETPSDEGWDIESEDVRKTLKVIEYYISKLRLYYDYFKTLLERESKNSKGTTATTKMT